MTSLVEILQTLRMNKQSLMDKYPIKELAVFGSYVRGEATNESDLDILVSFYKPVGLEFIHLAEDLEKSLGIKVDLVSSNAIKESYFSLIKPELNYV